MKKISLYLITFLLGFLSCIIYSNKYIHVSFMNATNFETIEIRYSIDDEPERIKHIKSAPISLDFFEHQSNFGKHIIKFKCKELQLEKTIEIFTLKNNYLDFEVQNEPNRKPVILLRHSLFPLVYM